MSSYFSAKKRPPHLLLAVLLILFAILVFINIAELDFVKKTFKGFVTLLENREEARRFVLSMGAMAPLAFMALQAAQIVLAPIPGEATGLIGGFLFGKWLGFFYSSLGLTIGSVLAFYISRQFRRLIKPVLKRSELYHKFEYLLERQGVFVVFVLFLIPGFPKDFLCYLLGLSRLPWLAFVIVCSIGRMPGTFILAMQGALIYDQSYKELIILLSIIFPFTGAAWYYRDSVYAWIERHSLEE